MLRKRLGLAGAGALMAATLAAGQALAAPPAKGATYKGSFGPAHQQISFKVSANGQRVAHFAIGGVPLGCQGGGFGSPQPASGRVAGTGTFTVRLRLFFAPAHSTTGTLVVTGRFLPGGRERGTISSRFLHFPKACDHTDTYTTKD